MCIFCVLLGFLLCFVGDFLTVDWLDSLCWRLAFMFEDGLHVSVFSSGGSGSAGSSKCDVLRRLIGGDLCKRAIFDFLSGGEWCSVFELCRVARSWDRGVGVVRVSTILRQFQESLGCDFLESRVGDEGVEWRINPDFLRSVASVLSELKSQKPKVDLKGSQGDMESKVKMSSNLFRSLLGKTSRDLEL